MKHVFQHPHLQTYHLHVNKLIIWKVLQIMPPCHHPQHPQHPQRHHPQHPQRHHHQHRQHPQPHHPQPHQKAQMKKKTLNTFHTLNRQLVRDIVTILDTLIMKDIVTI